LTGPFDDTLTRHALDPARKLYTAQAHVLEGMNEIVIEVRRR
jgi:hypothetical protein